MYVSTVDSGNLAGHLLVLRLALLEVSEAPLLGRTASRWRARRRVARARRSRRCQDELGPPQIARSMREALDGLMRAIDTAEIPHDLGEWSALLKRLDVFATEAQRLLGGLDDVRTAERASPRRCGTEAGEGLSVPVTPARAALGLGRRRRVLDRRAARAARQARAVGAASGGRTRRGSRRTRR